jgi:thiol-disulfide isomerase/thioredoxin
MRSAKFASALCALILSIGYTTAAGQDADPIHWKAADPITNAKPGATFKVRIIATIDEGWHLYSPDQPSGGPIPTRLAVASDQKFKLTGDIEVPPPEVAFDPNFNLETQIYEHEVTFGLPVQAEADAPTGDNRLVVTAFYQTCNDKTCLPPKLVKIEVPVRIGGGETQNVATPEATPIPKSSPAGVAVNSTTPIEFSYVDFSGKPRNLSEFRGKYVLLDFWATWCKPCLADIPHLKELYEKYKEKGFEILGMDSETLSSDEEADPQFAKETGERARNIVKTRGAAWTHATSETAVPIAVKVFGVNKLPTKILIDPQGKIVTRVEEGKELDQLLEKLLGGKQ